MTKRRHGYFSKCEFSTFELMLIAFTADIDPNLISTAHALATREFILARMLRQLYWRQRPRPEFRELPLLHELLFDADDRPHFYQDTRARSSPRRLSILLRVSDGQHGSPIPLSRCFRLSKNSKFISDLSASFSGFLV